MSNFVDPGRAPECFEFDSSDKSGTVVTLREGFTLEGIGGGITMSGPRMISADLDIPDDSKNYMTIGPITIDEGVTITVEGNWVIV